MYIHVYVSVSVTAEVSHCFCQRENDWGYSNFIALKVYTYISVSPRINEKGGGDLAGAQSMKLYLGAWCMYILHS